MTPEQDAIIAKTAHHVQEVLSGDSSGHDWWHVYRVWKTARHIAKHELVDSYVVELAALLHDIADWKMHNGDIEIGPATARSWLTACGVDEKTIDYVCTIVKDISFKGANVADTLRTQEGFVVQDADRLDAIGAIGIARAFAYGGSRERAIHNPNHNPVIHQSFEAYKQGDGTSINHFYEKLLLLKDRMHTQTGKKIAEHRHIVMEQYLEEFFKEWDGKA